MGPGRAVLPLPDTVDACTRPRRPGHRQPGLYPCGRASCAYCPFPFHLLPAGRRSKKDALEDERRPYAPACSFHGPARSPRRLCNLFRAPPDCHKGIRPPVQTGLAHEITDMAGICRGVRMVTDDPLGIGGLLCDATSLP